MLGRFLPKSHHTQRKLLYFKNWINGGLRSFQKSEFQKSIIFIFSEKKIPEIKNMLLLFFIIKIKNLRQFS